MSNPANQTSPYGSNGGSANAGNSGGGVSPSNWSSQRMSAAASPCSPEGIAWSMTLSIACCEGACVSPSGTIVEGVNRQWILGTYTDCLRTVNGCGTGYGQVSNFRQAS